MDWDGLELFRVFPLQLLTNDDVYKHLVLPNVTRMKVKCSTFWKLLDGVVEVKDAWVSKAGILNLLQREFFLLLDRSVEGFVLVVQAAAAWSWETTVPLGGKLYIGQIYLDCIKLNIDSYERIGSMLPWREWAGGRPLPIAEETGHVWKEKCSLNSLNSLTWFDVQKSILWNQIWHAISSTGHAYIYWKMHFAQGDFLYKRALDLKAILWNLVHFKVRLKRKKRWLGWHKPHLARGRDQKAVQGREHPACNIF